MPRSRDAPSEAYFCLLPQNLEAMVVAPSFPGVSCFPLVPSTTPGGLSFLLFQVWTGEGLRKGPKLGQDNSVCPWPPVLQGSLGMRNLSTSKVVGILNRCLGLSSLREETGLSVVFSRGPLERECRASCVIGLAKKFVRVFPISCRLSRA